MGVTDIGGDTGQGGVDENRIPGSPIILIIDGGHPGPQGELVKITAPPAHEKIIPPLVKKQVVQAIAP